MKTTQSTDGLERCKFTLLGSEYRITSRRGHLFGCVKLLHPPFSRGADSIKFPQRNFGQGTHIGRKMSFWSTENKMSVINFSTRVLGPIASFYENFMQIFSYSNPLPPPHTRRNSYSNGSSCAPTGFSHWQCPSLGQLKCFDSRGLFSHEISIQMASRSLEY